ncbi:MAG: tetraacyldisaccharide 4'-kinase [Rhodobacteraceae bacterium]|nr:tetraacyldisaccharide 4'-kinase [Paracoccaceae bacterium]
MRIPLTQPRFWNRTPENAGLPPVLLSPVASAVSLLADWRWQHGAHLRVSVPVVCVGNINMGGTGKTPTVIEVVRRLVEIGRVPHVVSRGYGGRLTGPVLVDPTVHSAVDTGDEPLLLAAFGPCWVAANRAAGAKAAIAGGADVIVLDDGMQNPSLAKDLTILVVDAEVGFGNGYVAPSGPLRQSIASGLERSDLILPIGASEAQGKFQESLPAVLSKPLLPGVLEPLQTGMDWQGLKAVAFAGIGRPEKFFKTLRSCGAEIVSSHAFSDHQELPLAVLNRMEREAEQLGAQLVTTEKDAVRLPSSYRQKVLTLPVRLVLEDAAPLDAALQKLFD